jgi:hypothetical protein
MKIIENGPSYMKNAKTDTKRMVVVIDLEDAHDIAHLIDRIQEKMLEYCMREYAKQFIKKDIETVKNLLQKGRLKSK